MQSAENSDYASYAQALFSVSKKRGVFAKIADEVGVKLLNTRENGCMISGCDQKTAEAFKQNLAKEGVEILSRIPVLDDEA